MKTKLTNVAIVSINCVNAIESIKAIEYSCRNIDFKYKVLITDEDISANGIYTIKIKKLKSVNEYNDFVLRLSEFVNADFVLLIQDDGFVINSNLWDNKFLEYDYIGAPWPNDPTWVERQYTKEYMKPGFNQVGNGGFSLRSKKFLDLSFNIHLENNGGCRGAGEDTFLCHVNYDYMMSAGVKFAPVELAEKFSYENNLNDWTNPGAFDVKKHFGFHGKNFINSQEIINLKNI